MEGPQNSPKSRPLGRYALPLARRRSRQIVWLSGKARVKGASWVSAPAHTTSLLEPATCPRWQHFNFQGETAFPSPHTLLISPLNLCGFTLDNVIYSFLGLCKSKCLQTKKWASRASVYFFMAICLDMKRVTQHCVLWSWGPMTMASRYETLVSTHVPHPLSPHSDPPWLISPAKRHSGKQGSFRLGEGGQFESLVPLLESVIVLLLVGVLCCFSRDPKVFN